MVSLRLALASLLLCAAACNDVEREAAAAQPVGIQVPALTGRVIDRANLLSPAEEAALTAQLAALESRTTDQLVVVTLERLGSFSIEQWGIALGRGWGIGQADKDNGVLLVVAPNDRKVRIEVGYGLEGSLKDEICKEIIDREMLPAFRNAEFPRGIRAGVDALEQVLVRGVPMKEAA